MPNPDADISGDPPRGLRRRIQFSDGDAVNSSRNLYLDRHGYDDRRVTKHPADTHRPVTAHQ
jgi:hypothetical protein